MRPVILFGGGLDSGAMVVHALAREFDPVLLYLDYGAKATEGEVGAMRYFARKHGLQALSLAISSVLYENSSLHGGEMATEHAKNYLPGRNLLFLSIGASYAASIGAKEVWTGFHVEPYGSVFEDAKANFLANLDLLMQQTYPGFPKLIAPFIEREREDYIAEAMKTEPELFAKTFSCYESRNRFECGKCTHCQTKKALFIYVTEGPGPG